VRIFSDGHRWNAHPRQTNGPANKAFHAVVLHTTAPGVPLYGYRHLSTELGRWVNRDPMWEAGGVNLYGFVGNKPVNDSDLLGFLIIGVPRTGFPVIPENPRKAPCEAAVSWFESTDYVRGLRERRFGRTGDQPCLKKINCVCCGPLLPAAAYNPLTLDIDICYNKIARNSGMNSIVMFLRHELSHAESLCGRVTTTCQQCMEEEMKAYYRSGGCWDADLCARLAWTSCRVKCARERLVLGEERFLDRYRRRYAAPYAGADIPLPPESIFPVPVDPPLA